MKTMRTLVAVLSVAIARPAHGQMMPPQPPRVVTSGEGQTRVTPDRATVLLGVQSRSLTAATAAADNAKRQRAILDTIAALGVPAVQVGTQNYTVTPDMRYDPTGAGAPKVIGYTVTNTVRVELKKMDQVGLVIDAAIAKGSNDIQGVQFSVSNVAEARRSAISEAVKNARADAESLAAAAGGSLGGLLELSSSGPVYRPVLSQVAMDAKSMVRVPTPIDPAEQVITASVSATWQFLPRPPL